MWRPRPLLLPAVAWTAALSLALGTGVPPTASAQSQGTSAPAPTTSPEPASEGPLWLDALTVRGLLDQGFVVQDGSTGTKTDTPLIEVPSSVNVINRQQLDSQRLLTVPEALQWVPGVFDQNSRSGFERFTIRGFFAGDSIFVDGLRADPRFWINQELFGMERVEVLKGPASVLYGQVAPGGIVNLVSKRPRFERHYDLGLTVGAHDFYEGTFDLGGAVNADKTVAVRFTGLYLDRGDFVDKQRAYFAPAVTLKLSDSTTLTILGNYIWEDWVQPLELPAEGTVLPNPNGRIPIERFVGEPGFNRTEDWRFQGGFILEHQFNPNLRLRSVLRGQYYDLDDDGVHGSELAADQRTLTRFVSGGPVTGWNIGADTNLEWTVQTSPVAHRVLAGVDVFYDYFNNVFYFGEDVAPLDLFAPVYGSPVAKGPVVYDATDTITQVGVYLQDQMKLFDKLTLLLGGRFDVALHEQEYHLTGLHRPRGLRLHVPGGAPLPVHPGAGRVRELRHVLPARDLRRPGRRGGVRPRDGTAGGRWLQGRHVLRARHRHRRRVPSDPPERHGGRSRQRGLQHSDRRAAEPGRRGERPGAHRRRLGRARLLRLHGGEITEDTTFAVGNRLPNTPRHSGGLWTTWTFPSGPFKGLGAGFGFRYVGERPVDLSNTLTLSDYVVLDAAVFYRRGRLSLDLNFKNLTSVDVLQRQRHLRVCR